MGPGPIRAEGSAREGLAATRERLRQGGLRGCELLEWLARLPVPERDAALEEVLGIGDYPRELRAPGEDLIGYVPSGVAALVHAVFLAPVTASDVFVDLGAGLGKAAFAVHLLTGARARGVELVPALARRAQGRARALALGEVDIVAGDARDTDISCGTVFFLYLPFIGDALARVLERLERIAATRHIVVCTLGLDLPARPWLLRRDVDAFWLAVYDGRSPSLPAPPPRAPLPLTPLAALVAFERPGPTVTSGRSSRPASTPRPA